MRRRRGISSGAYLRVLALIAAGAGGLATAPGAGAAPVLHADLTRTCAGCGLAGPPFPTLGGQFVSAVPAHLDQNLFLLNDWPIRQTVVFFPPTGSAVTNFIQGGTVEVQGRAIAIPGQIGLLAQNTVTAQSFEENTSSTGTVASHAAASFRLDGNVISGPAPTGTQVPATLHLPVRGFIGVNASGTGGFGGTIASADLLVDVSLAGRRHLGTFRLEISQQRTGPSVIIDSSGFLQILEPGVVIDNPLFPLEMHVPIALDLGLDFSAPVNIPFTIDVRGRSQTVAGFNLSTAQGGWTHHLGGLIDLADTVGFPTGSPVLGLPPGFTFNSPDGRVVDNFWLGGDVPPPVAPIQVAAPAIWLLASLGLAVAVGRSIFLAWWRSDGPTALLRASLLLPQRIERGIQVRVAAARPEVRGRRTRLTADQARRTTHEHMKPLPGVLNNRPLSPAFGI